MRPLLEEQILEGNHDIIMMCMQKYNKNSDFAEHYIVVPSRDDLVFKFVFEKEWKISIHRLERITIE